MFNHAAQDEIKKITFSIFHSALHEISFLGSSNPSEMLRIEIFNQD